MELRTTGNIDLQCLLLALLCAPNTVVVAHFIASFAASANPITNTTPPGQEAQISSPHQYTAVYFLAGAGLQ